MRCKCGSTDNVKSGFCKLKQRYRCKNCGRNFTVEQKSTAKSASLKRKALHLYLEGLGFLSIGRFLGVSNVSVLNWIRSFGEQIKALTPASEQISVVELDEMHTYVAKKKVQLDMDCC